ncbi:hypothetical protein BDW74DRAFT_152071 [Aspergillus multicolor]|uniref:uncharacterized protein n=1 Tax=Aspergillus multicolor TaxID=41759 RepID=UPI003CCDD51E
MNFSLTTEEALMDIKRFMQKYFTRRGTYRVPDCSKRQNPLKVFRHYNLEQRLPEAVDDVLGLHIGRTKRDFFIGWDLNAVNREVQTIEDAQAEREPKPTAEAETEEQMVQRW